MKIMFVIDSLDGGGSERSTSFIWYHLRSIPDLTLTIVALRRSKEGIENEILEAGFPVIFLKSKGYFSQSKEIGAYIDVIKPDLVHSVLFKSNLRVRLARLTRRFLHVESLVNCTYDPVRLKDPRVGKLSFFGYKLIDRFSSGLVDHFLPNARNVKAHYEAELGIPPEKFSVIYRGRDNNIFVPEKQSLRQAYAKEFDFSEDAFLFIHVGRQEFQKGHLVLLRAIEQLEKQVSKPVAFAFLGREGNATPDIKNFLKEHQLRTPLIWAGHRHDVAKFMAAADAFVFPSWYEGMAGAMIEAQAAALPVISSDIPVLHEVVIKGENALMFEPGNDAALSKCLLEVVENPAKRDAMSKRSLQNFNAKFRLESVNQETVAIYRQLVETRK
jgi:glycosyltransferase involved in cell wall biosynthesis